MRLHLKSNEVQDTKLVFYSSVYLHNFQSSSSRKTLEIMYNYNYFSHRIMRSSPYQRWTWGCSTTPWPRPPLPPRQWWCWGCPWGWCAPWGCPRSWRSCWPPPPAPPHSMEVEEAAEATWSADSGKSSKGDSGNICTMSHCAHTKSQILIPVLQLL